MTAQLPRFITGRIVQLTTEEKTRRAVALTVAEAHRRNEGASHQFERIPERAAVVDPASKPPEAHTDWSAVDGAGSASETRARLNAPADAQPVCPVRQETRANPGAPGEGVEASARLEIVGSPHATEAEPMTPPVPRALSLGDERNALPLVADEAAPEATYQPPVVTITVSGLPGAGKTTLTHIIRTALAREGIATQGPENLRSIAWHKAIAVLINRGLSVTLVKTEEAP